MLKTYLYIPENLGEKILFIAKAQNKSKAEVIRQALEKGIITVQQQGTASAQVLLKPAPVGTGVIAGGAVRVVVEAAGIHDIVSKSLGTTNKASNVYATLQALSKLREIPSPERRKNETK